ncbi:MAG: GntR family transcriptional regulator [Eubacteriales bacterium]|nr:GntR family transcriptional regulator [Eubacteriales bacterium]
MEWKLTNDRPIYAQLLEELKRRIISGYYKPGEKLKPVRELAQEARVNPNTMQKTMMELEREQLVFTVSTTGRYITEDVALIAQIKDEFAMQHVEKYYSEMEVLGFTKEDMILQIKKYEKNNKM